MRVILLALLLSIISGTLQAQESSLQKNHSKKSFILSGQVKASDNQSFYAPKTDNWRVQIQWMMPEGEIAKKDDVVVVFDSGSIESQIEQEEVSLLAAEEELFRIESESKQNLLEATYAQKRTALLLKKARIDANISVKHISKYDYEKNQLTFEKAVVANAKSKEALTQAELTNRVAVTKQKIKIQQHQERLKYNQSKLSQMSLTAKRSGPVLYANSPWTGEKIYVGMTVQASWKIAQIPSISNIYIEAWVHEVDYQKLKLKQIATLKFDAYNNPPMKAQLNYISTQPEERKQWGSDVYYRTKFTFDNNQQLTLLPGMNAQLEFTLTQAIAQFSAQPSIQTGTQTSNHAITKISIKEDTSE